MSHKHEQLAAEIRRALQAALDRGLQDPRINGMITITGVTVAPDRRNATVLVSILPAESQDLTMHGLKSAARHLRHLISKDIDTRQIPELTFRPDESAKKQAAVMEAISRAAAERERREQSGREAGSTAPDAYAQAPKDPPA
jgi:ribosome-binding factor A